MVTQRRPMKTELRESVLIRDNHMCRKCGRPMYLDIHHIIPIPDGQIDTEENLITLCKYCHREWEHIVYVRTQDVPFMKWLELPPVLSLIKLLVHEELWRDDMSAKDVRQAVLLYQQQIRDFGPPEASEVVIVDRSSPRFNQRGVLAMRGNEPGEAFIVFGDGKTEFIPRGYRVVKECTREWIDHYQGRFDWWDIARNTD